MDFKAKFWGCALAIGATACGAVGEDYAQADLALETAGDELQGEGVCPALRQVAADCPVDITWRNHGQYVSCVARYFAARVRAGDIQESDHDPLVEIAARSDVGMPVRGPNRAALPAALPEEAVAHVPDFTLHFPGQCDDQAPH